MARDTNAVAGLLGVSLERAQRIIAGEADKLFAACADDLSSLMPGQAKGRTCGVVWQCLACENHVILDRHLPQLIAYHRVAVDAGAGMDDLDWEDAYGVFVRLAEAAIARYPSAVVEEARRIAETRQLRGGMGFRA